MMKCYECGGILHEKTDTYTTRDSIVGAINVSGLKYYQCDKCNEVLYSKEMAEAIGDERSRLILEFVGCLPINDFVNATEAASMLGISRQALHKNQRIRRGFIYHIQFNGVNVYNKPSLLLYKKTGDGRFPLNTQPSSVRMGETDSKVANRGRHFKVMPVITELVQYQNTMPFGKIKVHPDKWTARISFPKINRYTAAGTRN